MYLDWDNYLYIIEHSLLVWGNQRKVVNTMKFEFALLLSVHHAPLLTRTDILLLLYLRHCGTLFVSSSQTNTPNVVRKYVAG